MNQQIYQIRNRRSIYKKENDILGSLNWVDRWFKSNGKLTIEEISEIFFKRIGNEEGRLISACHKMKGLCRGG